MTAIATIASKNTAATILASRAPPPAIQGAAKVSALGGGAAISPAVPGSTLSARSSAAIVGLSSAPNLKSQAGSITAKQANAMNKTQVQALDITKISAAEFAGLTTGLTNLSTAQFSALSKDQLSALSAKQVGSLSASQLSSLSEIQLGQFAVAGYGGITASQLSSLSPSKITALGTNVSKLSTSAVAGLGTEQIKAFSTDQAGALTSAQLNTLSVTQIGALSKDQISSLSVAAIAGLTTGLAKMSASQIGNLTTAQAGALSASALNGLTTSSLAALQPSQIAALSKTAVSSLSTKTLEGLGSKLGSFTQVQTQALTTAQIAGMSQSAVSAINLADFTAQQVAGLSATTIASMSASRFGLIAPSVASLSTTAVKGLTTDEIKSLSFDQASSMTTAQLGAMSTSQLSAYNSSYSVLNEAQSKAADGSLDYQDLVHLLQSVAHGGVNASELTGLKAVAAAMNAPSDPRMKTSSYLEQMFDNVVLGTSANADYNGGSKTATKLGNMTSNFTEAQANMLVGKWFLGTDNPSLAGFNAAYQPVDEPLYSAGGPKRTDVNQGQVGDCYFLAALASTADENPDFVQRMVQSNGNGTYGVAFQREGKTTWVTVDNQLAMMPTGQTMADGSRFAFDHGASAGNGNMWTSIVEKAYVEFRDQSDGVNSYTHIAGGYTNGLQAITGQTVIDYNAASLSTSSQRTSLLQAMRSALSAGNDVIMHTSQGNSSLNLVNSHMYAVTAIDELSGTVTLDNPWNGSGNSSGMKMQFTAALSSLLSNNVGFHIATGNVATI